MEGDSAASTPPVRPISFPSCRTDSPLELGNSPRAITAIAPADPASPFIVLIDFSLEKYRCRLLLPERETGKTDDV